jgi:hypothetical protein
MRSTNLQLKISRQQASTLLHDVKESGAGKVFWVRFIKRTTGDIREMLCRFDVKSFLKGGKASYNPKDFNLMCVFDMQKLEYRTVNLEGLLELRISGSHYVVTSELGEI